MPVSATLQKVGFWVVTVTAFALPWLFLPFTSEFFDFNKNFLLIASTLILLVLWAATSVVERQVRLVRSPLGWPMAAVMAAWLAATFVAAPNRAQALLEPGQAGTWVALGLWLLLGANFIQHKKEVERLVMALLGGLGLTAISTLIISSGLVTQVWTAAPAYLSLPAFNPTGSLLAAATAFVSALPLAGYLAFKHSPKLVSALAAAALILFLAGTGVAGYRLLTSPPAFLPYSAVWGIALEAFKVSPFFGTGPATFLADFARFRPVTYNLTDLWNQRFAVASSFYLSLLATVGSLGLATYVWFIARAARLWLKATKLAKSSTSTYPHTVAVASGLSALTAFALQLVLPANLVLTFLSLTYLLLLVAAFKLAGTTTVHEAGIEIISSGDSANKPILPWIVLALALLLSSSMLYLGSRAYAAEVYYQKALLAAAANDGKVTYDALIAAIAANPYRDAYRLTYSQVNLLLASSLASRTDLSAADRATITQLVQQAIREAKNAAALNPVLVTNLENLARVYRNLLNFAEGADAWAMAAYRQAIVLDPTNPNLRLDLGGVFFAQKNWDEAIRFFQSAVDLKPDLANAHYNLAAAYREKGDLAKAVSAMETVVSLVDRNSPDYATAANELADLRAKLGAAAPTPTATAASQLSLPQPLPTPAINPPLQLDQSLSPESPTTPSGQ